MSVFPFPAILTALQYASSAGAVLLLGALRVVDHDPLSRDKVIAFMPAALVYYVSVWSNTNLLRHANVDTFIAFRSSTPLIVAVAEPIFLGRPWPTWRTYGALVVILMGALEYVYFDSNFSIVAYTWAVIYVVCISFDVSAKGWTEIALLIDFPPLIPSLSFLPRPPSHPSSLPLAS